MDLIIICMFGMLFVGYVAFMLIHPYYVENRHRMNEAKGRYGFRSQNKRMIIFILLSICFFLGAITIMII